MKRTKTADKMIRALEGFLEPELIDRILERAHLVARSRGATLLGFRHIVQVMVEWQR